MYVVCCESEYEGKRSLVVVRGRTEVGGDRARSWMELEGVGRIRRSESRSVGSWTLNVKRTGRGTRVTSSCARRT